MNWLKSIGEAFYNAWVPEKRYLAYLSGLRMTLLISLFAVILGILIGILIAVTRVSSRHTKSPVVKFLNKLAVLYVTVIRGTPMIVQILIIYNLIFTSPNTNPVIVGAVCCGINSGAYVAEIIRAGIESIPIGQMEAGRSLGMPYRMTMTTIILPQAIRNILPALGNEFISLIKETSVVSFVGAADLYVAFNYIGSNSYEFMVPYLVMALIYIVLVLVISLFVKLMERSLKKSDRRN